MSEPKKPQTPLGAPPRSPDSLAITPIQDVDDIILDEHRKSPQFVYVQERVKHLPPPVKFQNDRFNWYKGNFRDTGIPLALSLSTQLFLASLLTIVPILLTYGKHIPDTYPLFSTSPPVKTEFWTEILRATVLVGAPYALYVSVQIVICLIPWVIFHAYRAKRKDIHEPLRLTIEHLLNLRQYLGYASAAILLAGLARLFYPMAAIPQNIVQEGAEAIAIDKIPESLAQKLKEYKSRPYQFYVNSGSLAFALVCCILLIEKVIVQVVSNRYHAHGLSVRIQINKFARRVTSSLADYFITQDPSLANNGYDKGMIIFSVMGKELLRKEDFFPYMDEPEAIRYFSILDPDSIGSLTQDQFLSSIDSLYLERSAIDRAYTDQNRIVGRFDRMMMLFVWIVSVVVVILALDPSMKVLLGFGVSILAGFIVLFAGMAKQAFESIVFILFTHPFDADDSVIIDDVYYRVEELGLWVSSYITCSGHLVYMSNLSLTKKAIINLRRSPIMNETFTLSIMPSTSRDKLRQLEEKILGWLKENQRDYVPVIFIKGFKVIDNEHMHVDITLSHRSNFNDMTKKDFRSRKFVLQLKQLIEELSIQLSPPIAPK